MDASVGAFFLARSHVRVHGHEWTADAVPDETREPGRGTSIRELGLMGPWSEQPSTVQYACFAANVVTSIFTSHFVAPTNP